MSSSFGKLFVVQTFGESHGAAVGVVIDGVPAGTKIEVERIQKALDRRRPGQSHLTSPRDERDRVEIVSGTEDGVALGSPICAFVKNEDIKKSDYDALQDIFRLSHADFSVQAKYGIRSKSGGGRSSARETIGRVIAGSIAETILQNTLPEYRCVAYVQRIQDIQWDTPDDSTLSTEKVEESLVRCPDKKTSLAMEKLIEKLKATGDTVGGSIRCVLQGVPAGLGEPVFDKLEADLGKAMLSLPASKSFEIGSGIAGTHMVGSAHNDSWYNDSGAAKTRTNFSGGVQGGISNGMPIYFQVGFKPVSTIFKSQETIDTTGKSVSYSPTGRHDPCVLPRAVPMVEAMANIVLCDHLLRQRVQR